MRRATLTKGLTLLNDVLGQTSFPVRYMPVKALVGYKILDTLHPDIPQVCKTATLESAHKIAKLLNEAEGYVYEP